MCSSANRGLKFHKHTAAYVAIGGTSRYLDMVKYGMEIEGGMRCGDVSYTYFSGIEIYQYIHPLVRHHSTYSHGP